MLLLSSLLLCHRACRARPAALPTVGPFPLLHCPLICSVLGYDRAHWRHLGLCLSKRVHDMSVKLPVGRNVTFTLTQWYPKMCTETSMLFLILVPLCILQTLSIGHMNRTVASTSMNRESSRSHGVFTLSIESKVTTWICAHLELFDQKEKKSSPFNFHETYLRILTDKQKWSVECEIIIAQSGGSRWERETERHTNRWSETKGTFIYFPWWNQFSQRTSTRMVFSSEEVVKLFWDGQMGK